MGDSQDKISGYPLSEPTRPAIPYKIGDRVCLARNVERFPHFIAKTGAGGSVVEVSPNLVRVRMDVPIGGCEEWDNEIQWHDDFIPDVGGDLVLDNTSIQARAHCPFCGQENLRLGRSWFCTPMDVEEDDDSEAVITEHHCERCSKSFGLFQ